MEGLDWFVRSVNDWYTIEAAPPLEESPEELSKGLINSGAPPRSILSTIGKRKSVAESNNGFGWGPLPDSNVSKSLEVHSQAVS